jgi:enoyl-CoA hydratase/carnithine racemase
MSGVTDEAAAEASPVLTERRGRVLIVTINRPQARNAINKAVAEGIAAAMDTLDGDPDLTVGILTGAGGSFCAGMDLKAFVRGESPHVDGRGFAGLTFSPPQKPLIAAVEGWALAGGCEIVLSCDLVIAADDAKFGIPEVKRGLAAAAGGLFRLPLRIPYHVAMELILTGDPVEAGRAYELGLVNKITPSGGALEAALEFAERIAANGPLAVVASKTIVRHANGWSDEEAQKAQMEVLRPVMTSEDAQEGARAFAEKRPPVWKSR